MAFVPVPNGMKAAVIQTYLNETIVNVFWAYVASAPVGADMQQFATILATNYGTYLAPIFASTWNLTKVTAQNWSLFNGGGYEYVPPTAVNGGAAGDGMPGQVCGLLQWHTGLRGRSFRGRTYLSGIVESYVAGDTLATPARTEMENFAGSLVTQLSAAGITLAVASFEYNRVPRVTGVVTPILTWRARSKVRTQRRRSSSLAA